jgi:GGDEF domain-containing protein
MLCKNSSLRHQKAQRYLLNSAPTISDFHNFLEIALSRKGCWIEFSWRVKTELFTMGLVFNEVLNSPSWRLYTGAQDRALIWEHNSCDIPLIHNLVAMHARMDEAKVQADGAMCAVKLNATSALTSDTLYSFHPSGNEEETPRRLVKSKIADIVELNNKTKSTKDKEKSAGDKPESTGTSPASSPSQLISAETGLVTYPAFLLMLEREYYLAFRANRSLSILIFSIECNQLALAGAQPFNGAIKEHLSNILKTRRKYDVLAHYKNNHFALIMPQTNVSGAKAIARRMLKTLEAKANPFTESLSCAFGAADVRNDGKTLSMVLMAAEETRKTAAEVGPKILTYRDLLIDKTPQEQEVFRQQCIMANLNHSVYGSLVEKLRNEISSARSGVFALPMFYHFLEHDYRRAVRDNQNLSVLSFALKVNSPEVSIDPQKYALLAKEILSWVAKIKRRTDVLTEYHAGRFALILPDTSVVSANALANRISEIVAKGQSYNSSSSTKVELEFSAIDVIQDYPQLTMLPTTS